MTYYTTEKYRIDIYADQTFTVGSASNVHQYDYVYFDKYEYHFSSVFGIKIFQDTTLIKSAVICSIGGGTGIHDTCTIIENDRLLICCSDTIFCLSIPDLTLYWRTQADRATCLEIYKYQDSYIIHGEFEISRLDMNGNVLWQQSGADIFTTLDGKHSFEINDDYILATDWGNRKYKIDFNGMIIK
ncbi:MAG: hypothetical protein ACEQSR_11900 [Candidatus Methylacidiphilales bacterium]